jgi:glycosyltransferase involved in cell wall biosynthesis
MKILFSSNVAWSIYNFRMGLLKSLQTDGMKISTLASNDGYEKYLTSENFEFIPLDINNNSKSPFSDINLFFSYIKLYKKIHPDIILHNAIKPNIYGTLAAGLLGIPVINNVSGLGTLFIKESISTKIAVFLYYISQKFAKIVFFQNNDDLQLFIEKKILNKEKAKLINGSGVDTVKFDRNPIIPNEKFIFLFVGRIIKDKGFFEFIEASKKINHKNVEFWVLGDIYELNETSITPAQLKEIIDNKTIIYFPKTDNVVNIYAQASCLVLPSYREGLSKVLIEASSMQLPIITTNVPGCKDVVIDNYNGFLCEAKDINSLHIAMEKMLNISLEKRLEFGKNARKRVLEIFDINIINNIYKKNIYSVLNIG